MLFRSIRPPVAGASPVSVDEASVANIPGVQVVRQGMFLAVVAPKEYNAVKAARQLKVTWSDAKPPFPGNAKIWDHLRSAPVIQKGGDKDVGNVEEAFKNAARVIEANYEWPFQSHASMGPACATIEMRNGEATLWTGSQKPHHARSSSSVACACRGRSASGALAISA